MAMQGIRAGIPAAHQSTKRAVSPYEAPPQYINPGDMNKSAVLSAHEMESLTRTAFAPAPHQAIQDEKDRRAALHKKSQNRYKNWGNTLEAQRNKKLLDRKKKEEEVEAQQKILDRQEAVYQDEKRRACIERANRMLFQQQDKTKEFQSSMLYSKVLAERSDQIKLHRRKMEHEENMDRMWEAQKIEQINYANKLEEEKEISRRMKSKELQKSQLTQLRVHQERLSIERQHNIEEGKWLQNMAQKAIEEERQVEAARKQRRMQNQQELFRANKETQKIRAQRAILEAAEEQQILEFAKKKEKKDQLRKDAIAAKLAAKQEMYAKMVAEQSKHLEKLKKEEDARHAIHAAVLEEKQEARVRNEAETIRIRKEQIKRSREEQVMRKAQLQERQQIEDAIMGQEWSRRTEAMQREGIEEDRRIIRKNIAHSRELKQQIAGKKARERMEKLQDLEASRIYRGKMARDDATYKQYTEEQIRDAASKGRSVLPMKLLLCKQRRRQTHLVVE